MLAAHCCCRKSIGDENNFRPPWIAAVQLGRHCAQLIDGETALTNPVAELLTAYVQYCNLTKRQRVARCESGLLLHRSWTLGVPCMHGYRNF